jgi:hypothetical protein
MPNTPTTSFIPKQGPAKRTKQTATRQVHLLAVFSYIAFITAITVSVGVFLYERFVEGQLSDEVSRLSQEINGFSDADMERVREFNVRLEQTKGRLGKSVSMASVFAALEEATVKSVSIEDLHIKKEADTTITMAANISTDSFDSSLFQRGVYDRNTVIDSVVIDNLTLVSAGEDGDTPAGVTFSATIIVPVSAVPVVMPDLQMPTPTQEVAAPQTASSSADTVLPTEISTTTLPTNSDTL